MLTVEKAASDTKSTKPPKLPVFSGANLKLKDEVSCKQYIWQVRQYKKTHTESAICTAIIESIRGKVANVITSMRFESDLDSIVDKIAE